MSDHFKSVKVQEKRWNAPAGRTALVDHVFEEVRQSILRGDYPAGSELPAAEKLAEGFGVSMTVIREALRALRSQGLVEVYQGKRPLVSAANSSAMVAMLGLSLGRAGRMQDLMQVRWVLEVAIAALAAEHATKEHIERLAAAVDEMRDGTTIDRQVDADVQFHRTLAEATGNPLFPILLQSLEDLLREFRRRSIKCRGVRSGVGEHAAVLKAVRARDSHAAREAMIRHMKLAEQTLRKDLPAEK
ncbi:MAG: FadR family transcriptional regulator [Planctomycetia bacterium]|nr:FadR family transcriptional regulator [Planctomycetia bacterium]